MAEGCKITKTKDGKINGVLDQSGNKSRLFKEIFNVPTLNLDEAIKTYQNIYSEELKDSVIIETVPDIRFQIIGEKGASNMEQYNQTLNQAKQLEKQGVDYNTIEDKTKWYKFKGQWKMLSPEIVKDFKIVDSTKNKELTLKEVLGNENILFKTYPTLGETKVLFLDKSKSNYPKETPIGVEETNGAYVQADGTIFINTVLKGVERNNEAQKYTLAHEVSHVIQEIEGFPMGGSLTSLLDETIKLLNIKSNTLGGVFGEIQTADKTNLTQNEKNIVRDSLDTIRAIGTNDQAYLRNQYKHILGEIDANIVEGALKIVDNQGVITTSYKELLQFYAQNYKIDLNNTYLLKNGEVSFQIIGEKGASKVEEYKILLDEAKQLDSQNKDYSQTGWFKNSDGQWKYMSNEYVAQFKLKPNLKINGNQNFEDVIEDNVIFQLYPEARKLNVVLYDNNSNNKSIPERVRQSNGFYSEDENTIYISYRNRDGKSVERIIGHELNHYLQTMEGFSTGSGTWSTLHYALNITGANESRPVDLDAYLREKINSGNFNSNEKEIIRQAIEAVKGFKKGDRDVAIAQSDRVRGEVDSRAVELAIRLRKSGIILNYEELVAKVLKEDNIDPSEVVDLYYTGFGYDVTRSTKSADQEVIDRLKERGLAENVFQMSTAEINTKLEELGADNVQMTTLGFVFNNDVYFNSDLANNETFVHEYGHLLLSTLKGTNKSTYDKGIKLVSEEIKNPNSEIKDIIEFIKETQPNLKGEALLEEILTETISRKAGEMMDDQKAKSPLMQWLSDFWETIGKMLGITNMTPQQIANLNLGEYATAMGVSLLQGESLVNEMQKAIEPSLTFETSKGETFNNYADALKATAEGMIKLKIAGVNVGEVNSDTNINTYHGVLNHFIKSGVLTGNRMLDTNGDEILVVSGETFQSKNLTVDIVEEVATKLLGASNVQVLTTGDIILKNTLNTRIINGETVTDKEVAEMTYEQMKKRFGEEVALTNEISKAVSLSLQPNFAKKRIDEEIEIKTDSELNIAIKALLNKMGIKITSIENYLKGSEARNGVPITANALMDVVNKVMAFRDGTITQEDLIEETMHLIEATLDPILTAGVRKNIHKTAEWKQFEAQYRIIYSKEYSGEQLEEVIRREILGKVMANAVATNFALAQDATLTQQSIYGRIRELLQDFFNKIENFFKPEYLQQIDRLNSDIYAKLMTEDLANELNFNDSYGSKLVLFSTSTGLGSELVQLEKSAREALRVIEFQTNAIGKNDASQKNKVRSANESMSKVRENFQIIKEAKLAQSELELAEVKARAELQAVFSIIVNVAQKQTAYLKRAVKKNAQSSYPFSSEEMGVFGTLVGQLDKAILPSMQKRLKETEVKSEAESKLLIEITKTLQDITDLKAEVGSLDIDANEKITQMLKKRLNLNDEKTDFVRQKLVEQRKEASWFFLQFGTLLHSSNILLNAAGNVITKSTDESNRGTLEDVQPFVEAVKQAGYLGVNAKELTRDGYLQNRFNDKIREEALLDKRFELYQKYDTTLTREEFAKKDSFSNLTSEQRLEFERDFSDWQLKEVNLSAFKPDVQLERKNKLMKYSLATQRFERDSSADYNLIMQEADEVEITDKNGDKQTVLTFNQDMKLRLEQAKKRRVEEKNLFRQDGTLEIGLEFTTEEQYNRDNEDIVAYGDNLFVKIDRTRADNNTVLSFELNQIDNLRIEEMKAKGIVAEKLSEKFKGAMEAIDPMDVYDFLTTNAYIGYNQEYYDTFENNGLTDRLEANKDGENDADIDEIINKIATLKKQQKLILQANRDLKKPSETNYSEMDVAELKAVLDTETRLESLYKEANSFLSKKEVEEVEKENISETVYNKAFEKYMFDSRGVKGRLLFDDKTALDSIDLNNINQIFRAVADHSTTNTNDRVSSLKGTIREVSSGRRNKLSKSEARVFSKTIEEYSEMSEEEIFASMTNDLLKYSYSKLLPYFKKSRPIGADLALEDLEAGLITAQEFISNYDNGEYQYLQISPNYTFQEANEDVNRDVHYQRAKDNYTPMFRTFEANATEEDMRTKSIDQLKTEGKFNQYVNTDFLKEYDIDMVTLFNTGKEVARTNLKKFDARQAFLELQKKTLVNADKLGRHNLYLLPQKEKGLIRKGEDILKSGKNVKGMLSELVKYREDDADLGKDADGVTTNMGVSKIPIYGFRKLKESEATDEILESYIWMNKESNLYKSRLKNIGDMFTIKEALLNDGMGQNLGIMATNTYKMFEDAMNYNFYGIKEVFSKEFEVFGVQMDAGKMLRNFGKLIRVRNLGFTVISPITSAITGYVQANFIEKMVGESVDKDAMTAGYKFFRRTSGDAMREVAGLQGKSELNAIGSRWGFFEFDDRFKNSGFGKKVRVLGQSVFATHQMANFPVNTPVGLSVLADHKFVDGQIIRFRNYKENNKGVPEKELRKEWENYLSILDATLVDKNGVVGYDYPKIIQSLNSNATIEEVENLIEESSGRIRGVVKMAIQRTDGQIATEDKATASRNAIMSFIGIHRNWLFLAASYKFKGRQLSTATGEYEEGSWKNTARFVSDVFKDAKNGKSMQLLAQIKKSWNDTDDLTRTNVKRTAIEMAVLNATIALMMGLMSLSGDDKEEDAYALKLSQLFSMRLANEISSSTVGLPKNLYDTLDGLVVGLNTLNVVTDAPKILSSDIIERGRYKGLTEREKYFYQNIVISREYYNLIKNVDGNMNSYRHFNFGVGGAGDYTMMALTPEPEK